jgi:hypothetical protein
MTRDTCGRAADDEGRTVRRPPLSSRTFLPSNTIMNDMTAPFSQTTAAT